MTVILTFTYLIYPTPRYPPATNIGLRYAELFSLAVKERLARARCAQKKQNLRRFMIKRFWPSASSHIQTGKFTCSFLFGVSKSCEKHSKQCAKLSANGQDPWLATDLEITLLAGNSGDERIVWRCHAAVFQVVNWLVKILEARGQVTNITKTAMILAPPSKKRNTVE